MVFQCFGSSEAPSATVTNLLLKGTNVGMHSDVLIS